MKKITALVTLSLALTNFSLEAISLSGRKYNCEVEFLGEWDPETETCSVWGTLYPRKRAEADKREKREREARGEAVYDIKSP